MYSVLFEFFILTEIPPYLLYPGPLQILDTGSQIYWEMKQQDVSTEKNAGKKWQYLWK